MKITFAASHLTIFGGGGILLRDYANKLSENGHIITIIALKIDTNIYKFNKKITIIDLNTSIPSSPLFWFNFAKIMKEFLGILNKINTDLIISFYFPMTYFTSKIERRNDLRFVYFCLEPFRFFHDKKFYSKAPFYIKLCSLFLRLIYIKHDIKSVVLIEKIISISDFTKKRVKKVYGRDSILHKAGIKIYEENDTLSDISIKEKFNLSKDTPILFALGLAHQLKGAKELIYIFKKIINKISNTVLIVGGYIMKENYSLMQRLIKKLKIPKQKVLFIGFIEKKYLNSYYSQSTLTLYTAIDESYGLIPLESMQNGTPVIAFEGGPSETILSGKTGYIIKNNEIGDFAKKAIKLIEDKSLHDNFSKYAKKYIKKNFNLEKKIVEFESILRDLL